MRSQYRAELHKTEFIRNYTTKTQYSCIWKRNDIKRNETLKDFNEKEEEFNINDDDKLEVIGKLVRKIPERLPRKELCENENEPLRDPVLDENVIGSNIEVL